MTSIECKICKKNQEHLLSQKILNRYQVSYYLCKNCGFLQTENPYWLNEAYSSTIATTDTGLLQRNIYISKKLTPLLHFSFKKDEKFLDIAGGYGTLTRLMRDIGFDFYWHDPYCENLHARGFEFDPTSSEKFAAVTAFEVLEHLVNPLDFISDSISKSYNEILIFSTELFINIPPESWWYYSLETGQHISFYQFKTLNIIARLLSLSLFSFNGLHILSRKPLNTRILSFLLSKYSYPLAFYIKSRRQSKTFDDHKLMAMSNKV